jgi:hypothetical protein
MVGKSSTVQVSTGKPARCRRHTTPAVARCQAIVAPSADTARTRAIIRPAWPRAPGLRLASLTHPLLDEPLFGVNWRYYWSLHVRRPRRLAVPSSPDSRACWHPVFQQTAPLSRARRDIRSVRGRYE